MSDFLNSWEEKKNTLVVFAGVFDPVHNGHLSAAHAALHYGDKVLFMPERAPQHKHGTAAYDKRLNMLRLATASNSDFVVVDYPEDHHWVVDTFKWLKNKYPSKKFVWLVGSDVAPLMEDWPGIEQLKELGVTTVLVMKREGGDSERVEKVGDVPTRQLLRPMGRDEKVGSSLIRAHVQKHKKLLPAEVYAYILENKLYSFDVSSSK